MAERNLISRYFQRQDKKYTKCTLCSKSVAAEHSNTSNLRRHFQSHHKKEYTTLKQQEDETSAAKAAIKWQKTEDESGLGKQPKIHTFALSSQKWAPDDYRQISGDKKLTEMICLDVQPVSIVEDVGFKNFVEEIQPRYKLPSRRSLRLELIPKLYEKSTSKIRMRLQTCEAMGITIDHWTSAANDAYMAVTAHFFSGNFIAHDFCLNVKHMPESHTAANIAGELTNCIQNWMPDYEERNIAIFVVADNASNVQAGLRMLPTTQFTPMRCFAHTLQLVLDSALKKFPGVQKVIAKAKSVISHFHHSSQATYKLSEVQKKFNKKQHKLKNQCPTRWNSTYYMIERLVEQKEPLSAVLASIEKVNNLKANEWKTAESYVSALKPFDDATKMLSASRYATLSMIIPTLNILAEKMKSSEMNDFAQEILQNIDTRWPGYEKDELYGISSYLDPRFKGYAFNSEDAKCSVAAMIISKMTAKYLKHSQTKEKDLPIPQVGISQTIDNPTGDCASGPVASTSQASGQTPPVSDSHGQQKTADFWSVFRNKVSQKQKRMETTEDESDAKQKMEYELDMFTHEPLIDPTSSPFLWWSEHFRKYPNLEKLARIYLIIPATSVPSERIFSKAGTVISNRRASLKPDHAEQLICLSNNLRAEMQTAD